VSNQCRAVVVHPDGRAHRCHMPAVEPFEEVVPTLCDYHLEMDVVWGIQVPESYDQHPTGVELLAAVARGLSKTTTFDLVGGHRDWMFWA
jgi:hypothetical protein